MMPPPDYTLIMNHLEEMQNLAAEQRAVRAARHVRSARRNSPARSHGSRRPDPAALWIVRLRRTR